MSRLNWSAILLVSLVLVGAGCAESGISGTSNNGQNADAGDLETHGDAMLQPDAAGADAADAAKGEIAYAPCVLGEAGPWETCAAEDTLDFGTVHAAETVTRLVRLDNTGGVELTITEANIADSNFSIQAMTYTDEATPTASDVSLPAALAADSSLFFEVSVTGPGQAGAFGADALEILVDTDAASPETVSIALSGDYGTCGPGTADCDGDASNGCEVDIANDPANCGACSHACVVDNAAAACNAGVCAVASCSNTYQDCDGDPSNGCEVSLNTLDNCGGCNDVCDFENATEQCNSGTCTFDACEAPYANCDGDLSNGCEADTDSSLSHCGGCNQACSFANADATCDAGSCEFAGCQNGWVDLNADPTDGCEYQCTFQISDDAPDAAGVDANCDGIDGDASRGIFVAKTGNDTNAGTRAAPLASIGAALALAQSSSGLDQIFVATGQYEEKVTLADGVSIFGGYDAGANWARNGGATTRIFYSAASGKLVAVEGHNISAATTLGMLDIVTDDVQSGAHNNYAVYCNHCSGLVIQNTQITAGSAGNGANGATGATGFDAYGRGYDGSSGGTGSCDGSGYGRGGSGGSSGCGRNGGRGGDGGHEGSNSGQSGYYGLYGTPGGYAGSSSAGDGGPGGDGSHGANGSNGQGGSGGQVVSGWWVGDGGQDGTNGEHGDGGGGGGGGGGQGGLFVNDGSGNAGGGGGGGGCGGIGGEGGQAGGSSFGLFVVDSTGMSIDNSVIAAGNGGNGGSGGDGGNGSSGGSGMAGGRYCTSEVGGGGTGGDGGDGGMGGNGGGGAGGNTYGIYRQNTTLTLPGTNTITTGQAGRGGTSSGNPGADGVSRRF